MSNHTVTKKELATRIAGKINVSADRAKQIIDALTEEIGNSLSEGDQVVLRNFGTFEVANHKAKVGRNPKKPETPIVIPARNVVKFKVGRHLKNSVEDSKE